jgi:hypothetical protein
VREFVTGVTGRLDGLIHGHAAAKDQVVKTLAKWISNPSSRG